MRDALVAFDCWVAHVELFGSHYLVVGEVFETFEEGEGAPLVYVNRDYAHIAVQA
ncbi:MAG: flavin reductase family protein [Hyphomicrobiales bacterium]|nr:flavin reductase family protein [Hyphomicrobiales bacterium]